MHNLNPISVSPGLPLAASRGFLDIVNEKLHAGRIAPALDELFDDLQARREEDPQDWKSFAVRSVAHPLCTLLHQDPFTYRAFSKPRGYAGDAVMMDYIYRLGEADFAYRQATPLGREIFRYMDGRPSARGVRHRRQLIAHLIDHVAAKGGDRVLAIASGHLREAELSRAVAQGRLSEFVAFDQDDASLAVVARDYSDLGVTAVNGSVRQVLARKANLGGYDFVYAAGLFDYLTAPVAAALTRRMFEMTNPGGLMLIPNFLTGVSDTGYMETFMNWHLIYRSDDDMRALAAGLPENEVASWKVFDDPFGAITYLLVEKTR